MSVISDSSYNSDCDNDSNLKFDREQLYSIFALDNIRLLKKALEKMTPTEIYKIVGKRCFCFFFDNSDEGEFVPYETINCFKYLVKKGLDINQKDRDDEFEEEGVRPFHYACRYNRGAIPYLLRKGADPNNFHYDTLSIQEIIIFPGDDFELDIAILEKAIQKGLHVGAYNEKGNTLIGDNIEMLISHRRYDKLQRILNLFLQYGFNINHQDKKGKTILHSICFSEDTFEATAKIMFERGFDFSITNKEGKTAIESAKYIKGGEETKRKMKEFVQELSMDDVKGASD